MGRKRTVSILWTDFRLYSKRGIRTAPKDSEFSVFYLINRKTIKKIFTIRFALDNLILFFGFITHSPLNALKKRNKFERLSLCNSSYNYQRKTLLQWDLCLKTKNGTLFAVEMFFFKNFGRLMYTSNYKTFFCWQIF